jgi:hypothetical protein
MRLRDKHEFDFNRVKEGTRISINLALLGICFTLFTFLIAFNPKILQENIWVTLQLVCAIPLLMTSLLARSKSTYTPEIKQWKYIGFITYLISYAFLINVIGIFLINSVLPLVGFMFFGLNIILALVYSSLEISYDSKKKTERLVKDFVFAAILIFLGVLPALGVY